MGIFNDQLSDLWYWFLFREFDINISTWILKCKFPNWKTIPKLGWQVMSDSNSFEEKIGQDKKKEWALVVF